MMSLKTLNKILGYLQIKIKKCKDKYNNIDKGSNKIIFKTNNLKVKQEN